jgi:toxin ParE1/3/4
MQFQVTWSALATKDLVTLCQRIAEDNPLAAERVLDEINEKTQLLGLLPEMGAVYSRAKNPGVREIQYGNYRILYQVLTIWHAARRDPRL